MEKHTSLKKQKNDEMIITTWIFSTDKFELSVEERILRESQFESSSQFETVLMDSKPQFKKWVIMKSKI